MTNYPYGFDNNITLPGVSGSSQEDTAITALRSSVFAIEIELGITPSGIYPDVRTRLDILESRLQFGISPLIPNDGYVKSPLIIWNVPQNMALTISDGIGAPTEDRLDGSLYMRGVDGYANNQLYVRLNGTWYPVQTEQFVASNDLDGYPPGSDGHLAQTVIGLYNHPFRSTMNAVGAVEDGYHVTWNNVDGYWEAQTGFIPGRDLAAFSGPYGRTAQTVIGIQGNPVSPSAPQDGYIFVWETIDGHWEPQHPAVVFAGSVTSLDGYITRTNIRSNKILQSPSTTNAGRIGMVNFGTSTDGSGGTNSNYAAILGGDRNSAFGATGYPVVVGGFGNISSDGYAAILNGNANTSSGLYSAVINGTGNVASATEAFVVDGYGNSSTAINSFVLNGGNNQAQANFSGILNGILNLTTAGATHSGIGWGQSNTISSGGIYSIILGGSGNTANNTNELIGPATGANVSSNFTSVLNGINHTIGGSSDHSVIIGGNTHTISASSGFSFIGNGNNLTATGLYATILNSTSGLASGLHSLILNGNTNSVTGSYSTIVNGNNNLVSGVSYTTILDGYQNTISGAGSVILDGYSNAVSGQWSSIGNGNFNTVAGRNSTILNGSLNNIDLTSGDSTILSGSVNSIIGTTHSVVSGFFNTLTAGHNTYLLGSSNTISSPSTKVIGSSNIVGTSGIQNRIFGNNNTLGNSSSVNSLLGNGNQLSLTNSTHDNTIFGSNNIIDGYGNSSVSGQSHIVQANYSNVRGQYGRSRLYGQEVMSNARFTRTTIAAGSNGVSLPTATINVADTAGFPSSGTIAVVTSQGLQTVSYVGTTATTLTNCTGGTGIMSTGGGVGKIGEVQWSKLVLDGYGLSGSSFLVQLQDTVPTNITFQDGYAYDMSIKIMVVNTNPIGPNPVVPARFYIDVLAHQEGGVLVIDNVNRTLTTPQASGTNWTVSVSGDGLVAPTNNQFIIQVDLEAGPPYVQPTNTPSHRRAVATIDMREISRI